MATDDRRGGANPSLGRMMTPAHRDGFWEDVDAALRDEAERMSPITVAPATGAGRTRTPPAAPRPPRPPRPARRAFTLSAAAVLLAAVVAALGLENGEPGGQLGTAAGTDPPIAAQEATGPAGARAAAVAWIDALAAGDMRRAWEELGPASKEAWASYEAFEGARGSFTEGLARWASVDGIERTVATVRTGPRGPLHVVTFSGERRLLDTPVDGAYAVVVREPAAGDYELEPFTPQGTIGLQFVAPVPGDQPAPWSPNEPVVIAVPAAETDVALVIDGSPNPVPPIAPGRESQEGVELAYRPQAGWSPGRHVVTAFALYGDGTPAATAAVLQVGAE